VEINNRRYLGNKYKLLSFIKEVVEEECGNITSFFDVFSGTGAVASAFIDKTLILNDILYSNHMAHLTWFSSEQIDEGKVKEIIDEYNLLKNMSEENYMTEMFSETYFSRSVCSKIGHIREDIEIKAKAGLLNERERAILITSLLYGIDKIARTVGHYDAYRKLGELPDDFQMSFPKLYDGLSDNNKCFQMDANDLVKIVQADVAYLDPPYNSRQYSDAYHLLENIAEWKKPEVFGVARKMDRTSLKSDYCTSKATDAFEDLIDNLNCKYILLSYNNTAKKANDRSNARISDEDIFRVLSKKGDVKVFEQDHKAFTTGKSINNDNKERLFLCVVKKSGKSLKEEYIASPLNYTGGKYKLLKQILPLFPTAEPDCFVDLFCGGCNVGINVKANTILYNDKDKKLIGLLNAMKKTPRDIWIKDVFSIIYKHGLSDSAKNGYEYYGCNGSDGLGSYNKENYLALRDEFNHYPRKNRHYYEMLYTLIVFSFNNQIRFNSHGEFNLPVGKRDFNNKMQYKLLSFMKKIQEQHTTFMSRDFRKINLDFLTENSFVYADPPYLITIATYNENGGWNNDDELDLLRLLNQLDKKGIRFALSNVLSHKGKTNQILVDWTEKNNYNVHHLKYNYANSSYHTDHTSDSDEVLITNF